MYIDEQVQGTIYFVDGTSFQFNTNDIVDDDISILQQATADDSFSIGGTYSSTLNMTIRIPNGYTNSYDIIGSRIVLKSKYGSEENYIMRGVFWITSADRYKDIYTISSSDAITWLDTIPYLNQTLYDNYNEPYNNEVYHSMMKSVNELKNKMIDIIDVVKGYLTDNSIANISLEFYVNDILNNLDINGHGYCALPSSITGENATHCPRDYAGWLSQLSCGFVQCFYNDDKPETSYIGFGKFETAPSDIIYWKDIQEDTLEIASFNINCYKIYAEIYNGVINTANNPNVSSINSIAMDLSGNAMLDGHYQYSCGEIDDDAYRSSVPLLQSILNHINCVPIKPFSCTYHGEKRFKLGQCVSLVDEDGKTYNTVLTKIQWNFRGGYELKCAGKDNRTLFDSARRTPSVRAKEQALTKTNYAIKKTETGLQANIDYINSKFETKLEDADGKTQDLNYWVDCLWNSMYGSGNTVDKIRQNTNALKGAIENLGGSINGWSDY